MRIAKKSIERRSGGDWRGQKGAQFSKSHTMLGYYILAEKQDSPTRFFLVTTKRRKNNKLVPINNIIYGAFYVLKFTPQFKFNMLKLK